jgi:hypothetical protein
MKRIALIILMALAVNSAFAELDSHKVVNAVVGEAAGESYKCKIAICAVIRTRGNLKGVYGGTAKHIKSEPDWVFVQTWNAWYESDKHDPTGGCKYWGGPMDKAYFEGKLHKKPVMTIDHTTFYR